MTSNQCCGLFKLCLLPFHDTWIHDPKHGLFNTIKGSLIRANYMKKIKFLVDSLTVVGQHVLPQDLIDYTLKSLGLTYDLFAIYVFQQLMIYWCRKFIISSQL